MGLKKLKLGLASLAVLAALGVFVFRHQTWRQLREENRALAREVTGVEVVEEENQRLHGLAAELRRDSPDGLAAELIRLRQEVERLRVHELEWEQLCRENRHLRAELGNKVQPLIAKEAWAYVGYGDPESAAQSYFWAMRGGDPTALMESMCPDDLASWADASDQELATFTARAQKMAEKTPGFQILGVKKISNEQAVVIMDIYPDRPDVANLRLSM